MEVPTGGEDLRKKAFLCDWHYDAIYVCEVRIKPDSTTVFLV